MMLFLDGFNSRIERDKTMAYKLMYIPNDDTQYYPFCRSQLVVEALGLEPTIEI